MNHRTHPHRVRHPGGRPPAAFRCKGSDGAGHPPAWRPADKAGPAPRGDRLALGGPIPRRVVLVPLDGSRFGEHALPLAAAIARREGARLLAAHVAPRLQAADSVDQFTSGTLYARSRRRRWEYLRGVVRRLAEVSAVPVTAALLEEEEVAAALAGMAEAAADLVVMASHGRSPFARFWRGSVADALVRRLSVPLLLVRGQDAPPDLAAPPRIRRVLVPLDGEPFSEEVLGPAAAWGTLTDAAFTLVRVAPPAPGLTEAAGLCRAAGRLRGRVSRVDTLVLLDDDPARGVLRCARGGGADLVALATRGRGGLSRFFRGSVADRVIRGSPVPVLVYRPGGA